MQRDLLESLELQDQQGLLETRERGVHRDSKASLDPRESRGRKEELDHREISDQLDHPDLQSVIESLCGPTVNDSMFVSENLV